MNGKNLIPNLSPDDVFEEAVARLETGESIESIVASYPYADTDELATELSIIQVALDIQHEPVPQRSPAQRMAAKQGFLAAAAELREREQAAQAFRPVRIAEPPRRQTVAAPSAPSLLQRVSEGLSAVFSVRTLRLAPVIVALAVVLLTASTFVTMAQSSVPGDRTYSFKQWMRKQELQFAPADRRELVRQAQEQELAEDVRRAAERADNNSAVIQAEDTQVFYGRTGRLLKIGGLTVMDRYQPDANIEVFRPMEIEGELVPGATVGIVYQILPGQSDTVQGISLSVLAAPTESPEPAVLPSEVDVQPRDATCTVSQPEGWVRYQVLPGDNLTYLAKRGGTTVTEVIEANCLVSETILIGAELFIPEAAVEGQPTTLRCGADIPEGWAEYEVIVGDNLTRLAENRGTTIDDVMAVNCLDTDTILIGSTLYLPADQGE